MAIGVEIGEASSAVTKTSARSVRSRISLHIACYSKHRREDRQILHPALAKRLAQWLATKKLGLNDVLFPISGRVVGGTERKTEKMMKRRP